MASSSSSPTSQQSVRDRVRVTACLEFLDTDDWAEINPERLSDYLAHWCAQITHRAEQLGGTVQAIQPHILWLGFTNIETLPALKACMRLCVPLLKKPLYLDANPVYIRIGVDVEDQVKNAQGDYETPYPSDPFFIRSHAQPGECAIQGDLVGLLPPSLPTERLSIHQTIDLDPEIACYRLLLDKPEYTQPRQGSPHSKTPQDTNPKNISSDNTKPTESKQPTVQQAPASTPRQPTSAEQSVQQADYANRLQEAPQLQTPEVSVEAPEVSDQFEQVIQHETRQPQTSPTPQIDKAQQTPTPVQTEVHHLSRPATAPTIPEVVSQRHSVRLPNEPEASPFPVYPMTDDTATSQPNQPSQQPPSAPTINTATHVASETAAVATAGVQGSNPLAIDYTPEVYFSTPTTPAIPNQSIETILDAVTEFIEPALQAKQMGRIVGISGVSGIGKSVLINHTLLQRLIPNPAEPSIIWFSAHCDTQSPTDVLPLSFWSQLIQNSIPLGREGGDQEKLTHWIQQSLAPVFGDNWDDETEDFFKHILAVPRLNEWDTSLPAIQHDIIAEKLYQFLSYMGHNMPMVIVIDDMHQMDAASQEIWVQLLEAGLLNAAPISVILTHTNTHEPSGRLAEQLSTYKQQGRYLPALIEPLSANQTLNLLGPGGSFAGLEEVLSPQITQQLIERSEGDFLSVSEFIGYLHGQQVFFPDPNTGELTENPNVNQDTITLPPTKQALISMRWDATPANDQHGLEVASMLGDRFALEVWRETCDLSERQQDETLQRLAANQWIMTDMQQMAQFRHPSFKTLIRNQIPDDIHQAYAQQIYQYYRTLHDNGQTVQPIWLAYYADEANLQTEALEAWVATASQANQLGNLTGINMAWNEVFKRLDTLKKNKPLSREHHQLLSNATSIQEGLASYNLATHPEVSANLLPNVVQAYRQQNQLAPMVGALSYLTVANDRIGHVQGALEALDEAIAHVPEQQYPHETLLLKADRLVCLFKLGQLGELKNSLDTGIIQSLQATIASPKHANTITATDWLMYQRARWVKSGYLWRQGQAQAQQRIETLLHEMQGLDASNLQGHQDCTIRVELELIQYLTECGEYPQAEKHLHESLQRIESQPNNQGLIAEWGYTALNTYINQHQWQNANDLILHSLNQAETAKEYRTWVLINIAAGRIALSEKRYTDASNIFESMATESANRHMAECALKSWRYLAESESAQGHHDIATDLLTKALKVSQKPDIANQLEAFHLSLALAKHQMAQGQLKEGGALLQGIWPELMKTPFSPLIGQTADAIAQLYTRIAQSVTDPKKQTHHRNKAQEFETIAQRHPHSTP